jgi:hypothetical protein
VQLAGSFHKETCLTFFKEDKNFFVRQHKKKVSTKKRSGQTCLNGIFFNSLTSFDFLEIASKLQQFTFPNKEKKNFTKMSDTEEVQKKTNGKEKKKGGRKRKAPDGPTKEKKTRAEQLLFPGEPKKPANAYITYMKANRQRLLEGKGSLTLAESSKILGAIWKEMNAKNDPDVKAANEAYDKAKKTYGEEFKKWSEEHPDLLEKKKERAKKARKHRNKKNKKDKKHSKKHAKKKSSKADSSDDSSDDDKEEEEEDEEDEEEEQPKKKKQKTSKKASAKKSSKKKESSDGEEEEMEDDTPKKKKKTAKESDAEDD